MREITSEDVPIVLVGNKCDMTEERTVTKEDILKKAQSLGTTCIETSTKDNINIKEIFELLLESMLASEEEVGPSVSTVITVGESDSSVVSPGQRLSCVKC